VQCGPTDRSGVATVGDIAFHNSGQQEATITAVTLRGPHLMSLLASYTVPVTHQVLVGTGPGVPTGEGFDRLSNWSARRPAVGTVVKPGTQVTNLVLVLQSHATVSSSAGVDMSYTSGGASYAIRYNLALQLHAPPGCGS